jgi:hypothetical protein
MKREQYGATPLLRGPAFDDRLGRVSPTDSVLFSRRWSAMPEHEAVYASYRSDWQFFWSYQINEMYLRYFMWQFAGRASDVQGAAWTSGLFERRAPSKNRGRPSERGKKRLLRPAAIARIVRPGLPPRPRPKRALAVGVLFFMTGLGIVLYLNQTPLQPRERDYSYAGSFFAFSLWIGIGAAGVVELITDAVRQRGAAVRPQLYGRWRHAGRAAAGCARGDARAELPQP